MAPNSLWPRGDPRETYYRNQPCRNGAYVLNPVFRSVDPDQVMMLKDAFTLERAFAHGLQRDGTAYRLAGCFDLRTV